MKSDRVDLIKDKRLTNFIVIAETGSLTKAARQLYISQSALSQQLLSLEKDLGFALVQRHHYGITLTEAGEFFLSRIKEITAEIDDLVKEARNRARISRKTLTLGLRPDADSRIIGNVCPAFHEQYPSVQIILKSFGKGLQIDEMLKSGFDLLEIPYAKYYDELPVTFHQLCTDKTSLCVPPGHPLAQKDILTENDLAGQTIVLFPEGRLDDCDHLRNHLTSCLETIHFIDRQYDSLTATECLTKGWLLHSPLGYAFRYAPLIPKRLSWNSETKIGLVSRKHMDPLEQAFILVAKNCLSPEV